MKIRLCMMALVLLVFAGTARAQSGCSDSPECPTPILAMAGAVGLWAANRLKK